ncbi:MAG: CPBP family intramembrane metalloprotease [Ignavibacteriaceae bacterium]|nr:CPBP family intramembrane metalloprotease [Ignavibacteriaceae bacterium]
MQEHNQEEKQPNPQNPDSEELIEQSYSPYPLISPVAAAFLGLIGGFILYQFVGGLLTMLIFGFDLEAAPVNGLRFVTIFGQILFIFFPALFFSKWIYGDVSKIISLKLPQWRELLLFVLGIIILTPLLQSYLYIQNYFIEKLAEVSPFINSIKFLLDSLNELIEKTFGNLIRADNVAEMLLVIITISVVPAICEEVMFRGYIQRSFGFKFRPHIAAILTAVFFALYHFNPYGLIPLITIGFFLGFAAYSSQSLVIPIIIHFLNNFFAVILYFIIGDDELFKSNVSDAESLDANIIYFLLLLFMFVALMFIIKNYYKKNKIPQEV